MASNKEGIKIGAKEKQLTPLQYIDKYMPIEKSDPVKYPGLGTSRPGTYNAGFYADKVKLLQKKITDEAIKKAEKAAVEGTEIKPTKDDYTKVALLAKSIVTCAPEYAPAIAPIVKQLIEETITAVELGEYKPKDGKGDITDPYAIERFISRAKALLKTDSRTIIMKGPYFVFGWVDKGDEE